MKLRYFLRSNLSVWARGRLFISARSARGLSLLFALFASVPGSQAASPSDQPPEVTPYLWLEAYPWRQETQLFEPYIYWKWPSNLGWVPQPSHWDFQDYYSVEGLWYANGFSPGVDGAAGTHGQHIPRFVNDRGTHELIYQCLNPQTPTTYVWCVRRLNTTGPGTGTLVYQAFNTSPAWCGDIKRLFDTSKYVNRGITYGPTSMWPCGISKDGDWSPQGQEFQNATGITPNQMYNTCYQSWQFVETETRKLPHAEPDPVETNTFIWVDPTDPWGYDQDWEYNTETGEWEQELGPEMLGPEEWYLSEMTMLLGNMAYDTADMAETEHMSKLYLQQLITLATTRNEILEEMELNQHQLNPEVSVTATSVVNMTVNPVLTNNVNVGVTVTNPLSLSYTGSVSVVVTGGTANLSGLTNLLSGSGVSSNVSGVTTGDVDYVEGLAGTIATSNAALVSAASSMRQAWDGASDAVGVWLSSFSDNFSVSIGEDWAPWAITLPVSMVTWRGSSLFPDYLIEIKPEDYRVWIVWFRALCYLGLCVWGLRKCLQLVAWGISA